MRKTLSTYKTILLLILISVISIVGYSQDNKQIEANAKQYIYEKQYYKAADLYWKLLKISPNNEQYIYDYANSQRYLLNYLKAYEYYSQLDIESKNTSYTNAYFYQGKMAKYLGYYNEAINAFENYIKVGNSKSFRAIAEQEIEACRFSLAHQFDSSEYIVTHLPPPINSGYSEFNPRLISSHELVFSRYQSLFEDSIENVFDQSYYSEIYISRLTQQGWQKEKLFNNQFSSERYFSGNICFNIKKTEAYFRERFLYSTSEITLNRLMLLSSSFALSFSALISLIWGIVNLPFPVLIFDLYSDSMRSRPIPCLRY